MTNELGRAVVLLITLQLQTPNADPALEPIRDELEAFAGLFAHRCRSAANYHETARGRAILELGPEEALEGGPQGFDLLAAYNQLRDRVAAMEAEDAVNPA